MKDYKYEKVEGRTVGQVVDAALKGSKFVEGKQGSGFYVQLAFETIDVKFLQRLLHMGSLLEVIEAPWWEKYVGGIVMARDCETDMWVSIMFHRYKENSDYPFISNVESGWKYMRPLTAAEKDAIITEG